MKCRFLLTALLAGLSGAAHATCSLADRESMKAGGMSLERIGALCGNERAPARPRPVPLSKTCQTPQLRCQLPESGKPGESCWCNGQAGAEAGVVVR